jgi:two-component system C4-dicarboxylate transport sensor histidine kinase DctB
MGRYQRWLATLVDSRGAGTTPAMWTATAGLVLGILVLASYVEPVASWFHLQFWPALACFIPSFVFGLSAGIAEQRGRMSLRAYGFAILVGCTLLQFFFASLVVLSRPPGSFVLASLFVLTLAFHGHVNRTSVQYPFMLVCSSVAVAGAFALSPTREAFAEFAFVFPTGLFISLMTGHAGLQDQATRRARDRLKQAVHYRTLTEHVQANDQMSRQLTDLLSYNHDAGNTLSTVFLNAQLMEEQAAKLSVVTPEASELIERVAKLVEQLQRLKVLIRNGHQVAECVSSVKPTAVLDVIDSVAADCRSLFPQVEIDVAASALASKLAVRVHEGAVGLRRIVENVLYNACEGDGVRGAQRIQIEILETAEHIRVRCLDDGPGFSTAQLTSMPQPLQTTKAEGQGLGLFSIGHLVQASGGELFLQNASGQGAVVDVQLIRDSSE